MRVVAVESNRGEKIFSVVGVSGHWGGDANERFWGQRYKSNLTGRRARPVGGRENQEGGAVRGASTDEKASMETTDAYLSSGKGKR